MSTKIKLTDSIENILFKMSEGNPGALRVCCDILKEGVQIDPDNALGGLGVILSLDTLGFYGPKIWMLYKDVCDEELPPMLAVLRGWQLGYITDAQLSHAVENYGDGINVPDICGRVTQRLPNFKMVKPEAKK